MKAPPPFLLAFRGLSAERLRSRGFRVADASCHVRYTVEDADRDDGRGGEREFSWNVRRFRGLRVPSSFVGHSLPPVPTRVLVSIVECSRLVHCPEGKIISRGCCPTRWKEAAKTPPCWSSKIPLDTRKEKEEATAASCHSRRGTSLRWRSSAKAGPQTWNRGPPPLVFPFLVCHLLPPFLRCAPSCGGGGSCLALPSPSSASFPKLPAPPPVVFSPFVEPPEPQRSPTWTAVLSSSPPAVSSPIAIMVVHARGNVLVR